MSTDDERPRTGKKVPVYRVGKGKPPLETRFKKGVSGNPTGGRKRPLNLWEVIEGILANRTCAIMIDNKRQVVPIGEALIMRVVNDAMQGKPAAVKLLVNLWMGASGRAAPPDDDGLSHDDEAVLEALRMSRVGSDAAAGMAGELRVTLSPDDQMAVEADGMEAEMLAMIEAELSAALDGSDDPVGAIEALLASKRPNRPSAEGAISVSASVTSILQKGDGFIEIRSS